MIALLLLALSTASADPRVVTLADALRAAETHPTVRQSAALAGQADARARQSFAAMLPSLNGSAGYNLSYRLFPTDDGTGTGTVIPGGAGGAVVGTGGTFADPNTTWTGRLTTSQLLLDAKTPYAWLSSRKSADAAEDDLASSEVAVALGVRRAYFAAVAARALVDVAEETLANEERHLAQVEAFVEIGTRPPIDLAEARRTRANARLQLVQAGGVFATARAQLASAMGVTDDLAFTVADEPSAALDVEDDPLDALVAIAWAARPDARALGERVDAQRYALRAATGAYAPSLSLSGIFSTDGKALDAMSGSATVGVGLAVPIYQGGSLRAVARQQRWALEAIEAQRDQLALAVRTEVAQARAAVVTGRAAVEAAAEVVAAARAELALAEGRYEEGVGSAIELFNARVAVRTALGQEVQARYDLATARAQLQAALGRR